MRRVIFVLVLLLSAAPAFAANHFIRDGGSGSLTANSNTGDCIDWSATHACDSLPSVLVRGDVYYVANGVYPGYHFDDAASGVLTITIKGATVADHGIATGWLDTYAVGPDTSAQAVFKTYTAVAAIAWFDRPYIVIDGNTPGGCDPTHLCGIKFDIRGATDAGLCIPNNCYGVYLNGQNLISPNTPTNITIKYVDIPGNGQASEHNSWGVSGNSLSSEIGPITLQHNWIHDYGWGAPIISRNWSGDNLAEYNYIEKNFSNECAHANAWSDAGSNVIVRYNQFWDIFGTGFITSLAACVDSHTACDPAGTWQIYGNVFGISDGNPNQYDSGDTRGICPGTSVAYSKDSAGPGLAISCINGNACDAWKILNNTFYNFRKSYPNFAVTTMRPAVTNAGSIRNGDNGGAGDGWTVENNLFWCDNDGDGNDGTVNCASANIVTANLGTAGVAAYNAYAEDISGHTSDVTETSSQTLTANPFTDSANHDMTLSAATDTGDDTLTFPYLTDPTGQTRGTDTVVDRGAYEFVNGVIATDTTNPVVTFTYPASATITNANGSQRIVVFSASDDSGSVDGCQFVTDVNGEGTVTTGEAPGTIGPITLHTGTNVIVIGCTDATGNVGTVTQQIIYSPKFGVLGPLTLRKGGQ